MKRFFWGMFVALLILIAVPLVLMGTGVFNMAATEVPGALETTLASWTVDRSVKVRAPQQTNPVQDDPEAVATGMIHYRTRCLQCHGAPSVKSYEFAKGLNPPPPELAEASRDWTDGELFWITKNGIRMTGMPAFGPTYSDDELWKIVAFVRKLDHLSDSQVASLREGEEADHHHEAEVGHAETANSAGQPNGGERVGQTERETTKER